MKIQVISDFLADKGKIYDVTILAKKFNGYYAKFKNSTQFICNDDIRVLEMSEEEKQMSVYMQPGYPGKEW